MSFVLLFALPFSLYPLLQFKFKSIMAIFFLAKIIQRKFERRNHNKHALMLKQFLEQSLHTFLQKIIQFNTYICPAAFTFDIIFKKLLQIYYQLTKMIFKITRPYIFSYAFEIFWRWKLLWERITFIRATSSLSVIACILYAWIICNFKTHESLCQMHFCVINLLVEIK